MADTTQASTTPISDELVSVKLINDCKTPNSHLTSKVRRFALAESELSFDALALRAFAYFGISPSEFHLSYTDDENDKVRIGITEEIFEALRLARLKQDVLRIRVVPNPVSPLRLTPTPSTTKARKVGVAKVKKAGYAKQFDKSSPQPTTPAAPKRSCIPFLLSVILFFGAAHFMFRFPFGSFSDTVEQKVLENAVGPQPPTCSHYLHTIYTDPYFDSHKGDSIVFRDWSNQLRTAKVLRCGSDYYFYLDGKHSETLNYKRWNGEAWTATVKQGSEIKFHHVKANSGGRTSFNGRAFEVTNSAGQRWVSAVTSQHEPEPVVNKLRTSVTFNQPSQQAQDSPKPTSASSRNLFFIGSIVGLFFLGGVMTYALNPRRPIPQHTQAHAEESTDNYESAK